MAMSAFIGSNPFATMKRHEKQFKLYRKYCLETFRSSMIPLPRLFQILFCGVLLCWCPPGVAKEEEPVTLTVKWYRPNGWEDVNSKAERAAQFAFFDTHPHIRLKRWTALSLPGDMFQQADLLAFAGGVAADVQPLFIHQLQFFAQQGLLAPLNAFLETSGKDGGLWKTWERLPETFREAGTYGGKVFGLPVGCYTSSFVFRRDVFEECGLDPDHPPATLDELWRTSQKLVRPAQGNISARFAFSIDELEKTWLTFFYAYGVSPVEIEWKDASGQTLLKSRLGDTPPPQAATGAWKPTYKLTLDSPRAIEALSAIWKFRWSPWIRNPETGEIRDLSEEEAQTIPNIQRGVVYPAIRQDEKDGMHMLYSDRTGLLLQTLSTRNDLLGNSNIGLLPFPPLKADEASPAPLLPVMMGLNKQLTSNPRALRAGWEWISYCAGEDSSRLQNEIFAEAGRAKSISLWELRRTDMEALIAEISPQKLAAQKYLYSGKNMIPYFNGWIAVDQEIINGVIRPMLANPNFDYTSALRRITQQANEKVLGHVPAATKKDRAKGATVALTITAIAMLVGGTAVIRRQARQARQAANRGAIATGAKRRSRLFYSAMLLGPALILLAIFHYYPIGRGMIMAFQDYRLVGDPVFNGLDNFSEALFASRLWLAVINTIFFVSLNLGIGFLAPFLLAVLVSEVPKGTAFFRTIYYIPAVTAGLVVSLLWMRIYLPSSEGLLNQGMEPLVGMWNAMTPTAWHIDFPLRWLQDSRLAMVCVVIPTIWASAGPGSLIYLAALKGIPEDVYEAADLDGCSIFEKFRHVTLPALFPLLLINFVGAFIGTFQGMGNIFVMTGGGPNFATHVLALEIWQNAFLYLRFGVATAQSWMLAATLIGFIVIQMRILEKMDWRKADN